MSLQERFDQLFSEIVLKTINIILKQRVIFALDSGGRQKSSKWLNLQIEEIKELTQMIHKKIIKPKKKSLCLDIYIETGAGSQENSPRESKDGKYRGGIARNLDREKRKKKILLERWVMKYGEEKNESKNLPSGYKKAIALIRSLYSYVLLLPAFELYQQNLRNRAKARLMKFEIFEGPEESPLNFKSSDDFGSFQFSTIETQVSNISFEMKYRLHLENLPKSVPTSILVDVKDSYIDNMMVEKSPTTVNTRPRTHSLPPAYQRSNSITIKRKNMMDEPGSPQARSNPRDIPSTRPRSYSTASKQLLFESKSPPFTTAFNSLDNSPSWLGQSSSLGTPPFDHFGKSNSFKGGKPRLGSKVSPFDSPPLGGNSSQGRPGSLPHRWSGSNNSFGSDRSNSFGRRQSSIFKRDSATVPSVFIETNTPSSYDNNNTLFASNPEDQDLSPNPPDNNQVQFHSKFLMEDVPESPLKTRPVRTDSPGDRQFAFIDEEETTDAMDQEEQIGSFLHLLEQAPNLTSFGQQSTTVSVVLQRLDELGEDYRRYFSM